MAYEPFPNYPSLADAIEDAEKLTIRWSHDNVRHLSAAQVAAIVTALRATVSEKPAPDLALAVESAFSAGFSDCRQKVLAELNAAESWPIPQKLSPAMKRRHAIYKVRERVEALKP